MSLRLSRGTGLAVGAALALTGCLIFARAAAADEGQGPKLSPAAEAQLDEGLTRLYSLDYARSRAAFRKLIELEPDNPFGYLFEAGGIWWESSAEFGLFTDTPTLQGLFEEDVDESIRKAEAWSDSKDPRTRADGYFAEGMARGTLGQWRLMKHHYIDAYFEGKKAIKALKKCKKLDSNYSDADLGLGVFEYESANLSGLAKMGILLGIHGNEKKGLELIQSAVEHSRYSVRQAASFLVSIDVIDKRDFAQALPEIQLMEKQVPDSPYYLFLDAYARFKLNDAAGSQAAARRLYAAAEADPVAFRTKWLTIICSLSGADCMSPGAAEASLAWIDDALLSEEGKPADGFQALLHLFRGQILEDLGRRAEAVPEYRKTLILPAFDFTRVRASLCLAGPCGRDSQLLLLKDMAEGKPIPGADAVEPENPPCSAATHAAIAKLRTTLLREGYRFGRGVDTVYAPAKKRDLNCAELQKIAADQPPAAR